MRKLSKILALVLVLMMAFAVISAFSFTSSAANIPAGTKLYLVPSANWNQSNARFAAYFFGSGEAWVSMTKVAGESNLYEVTVPAGSWTNVIFCRMNPSASANNWNNKWNQTSDLVYNGTSNCYTVKEGTWDKGGGTWSTYGSACAHTNVGAAATCTKDQLCLDCGDPVASALGHTYNSAHLCTRCNEQAAFTVAGSGAHLGTEWDTGNTANDMTYADGVYTKVYTNVAAGSYLLKVVRDHDWGTAYPSADKAYTVATAGSTVTVTLKGTAVTVTVEAPHTHSWSEATCTEPAKCECGEVNGEALGHDMVAGEVVAPTFDEQGYTVYACSRCDVTENRDFVDALVAVAQIGDVKYASLQEALNVGGEVVLLSNIGLTDNKGLSVPAGVVVVLDLNGHVLGSNAAEAATSAVITNKGTLTIKDSVGGGKITTAAVNPDLQEIPGYASNTITNYGVLVLESGTIENTVNAGAAYAVDNSSNGVTATFTMNGGKLTAVRCALRMFCNSAVYENNVTINGGEIVGGTRAIWIHLPGSDSTKAAAGNLTVNGGTLNGGSGQSLYVYTYGNNHTATFVTITGGTFLNDVLFGGGTYKETQETVSITGGTFGGYLGRYLANDGWEDITGDEGYHLVDGVIGTHVWSDATCVAPQTCVCGATQGEALEHNYETVVTAPTCTEAGYTTYTCACGDTYIDDEVAALGHVWENCACTGCDAVLPTLGHNDSFSFSSQDNFDAAVATGKLALVGAFRDNGGSFQFNANSTIQFVVPANTTVTIAGHSAQYGVFNVYLNGEKTVMEGALTFTVTEETKVVIATGDNGASYSYIKSITLAEYVDRTITSDTTINFGSEGNYKDSVVDFSGIQIGDNGGNNSQVKNGSFDILLKAGSKVVIHGYPGYTSYKLNDGEEITSEYYTYLALEDMVLTVTPVNGNNYFYSIEVTLHTGVTLVEAKNPTCTEAGHGAYYACSCHNEPLTDKGVVAALGHTAGAEATCTAAQTCTVCGVVLAEKLAHEWADATCTAPKTCTVCNATEGEALGHKFFAGVCTVCEVADPDYNAYLLNFSQWPEFPKETYADGDIFKYNDIFTFIMSKNSRVDASAKTWEDFEGTLRFSLGGKTPTGAVPSKNALQITVDGAYTIKIWYVAGGDARYFALMNAEGTVLSETTNETVKNGQYYAELVIPAAGTYYLGVPADNNYIFQIELVKHEHTAGAEATCTTAQTCTVCGVELVAALGHTAGAEATCTTAQTCTVCGVELVAALGHSHSAVVTAPTCTEAGYTTYTCACGDTYTGDEVAALGHNYEAVVTAPTCTGAGYTTYTCACGDTYTGDEVAALEHEYVEGACTVCGKEDPNYVPPHEHNFVEGKCECGETDPNYVPEQPSVEEPAEELNFFEKIIAWIVEFFNKLIAMFKKN